MSKMTPEIHLLLASFGYPKLKLIHPQRMASIERKRAAIHTNAADRAGTTTERQWRFMLRNNAIARADKWLPMTS